MPSGLGSGCARPWWCCAGCLVVAVLVMAPSLSAAEEGPPGITVPEILAPYDPAAPACAVPPLLSKTLVFAQDNDREFMEGVNHGLAEAARVRGLDYRVVLAGNDPVLQEEQVRRLAAENVGAVVAAPVDPPGLAPGLQELLWKGAYVGTVVPPPATTILNAPQYLTGKTLGDAAAAYIRNKLDGRADVVLLTQDSIEFLAPRFVAIRDALKDMPGVAIVADISPNPVDKEGGMATMKIVLEAHPDVDVVLGADAVVLGALAALRASGKDHADQYLGGIDGEPEAVAEIRRPDSPYKTSIALSSPVFGYALGEHAANWLEGRSVPQAMDSLPIALTINNLAAYEADLEDPAAVYADPARRDAYLRMYGNICYDTRDAYLNFPWSSEARVPR
jgi:ribose transport system substrate-binding protein